MKILIIRNFPSYMAVKNNTYNIQEVGLAKALVRKGHFCDIIFWTDKAEEIVDVPVDKLGTVHVFYRCGKTVLKNTVYPNCNELFEQYDILQPCEYNQIQAWLLAKRYPEKTIVYHGPYYSPFNKRYNLMCKAFDVIFLRRYLRLNTQFMVKSNLAKKFLVDKGIKQSNVHTVGVGIDTQMLASNQELCDDEICRKMVADKDIIKILYVGRFEERRNIRFIIDIFHKVQENNDNVKLYLIGTGDKEYVQNCFSHINELRLEDKVVWQEKMEQKFLSRIYQMADFFLLPTEYEIFGMVLLEAMYYKNIILTTNNGGSSTLIENEVNGFVLENKDVDSWAKCIKEIYSNKRKLQEIQENAFLSVANKFTWDVLAEKFIEQYKNKLNGE